MPNCKINGPTPDGCAPVKGNSTVYLPGQFNIPNPRAPEENYPAEDGGDDLSWVAGVGGAKGCQPITSTNPNGDYQGTPITAGSGTGLRRDGSFMPDDYGPA